MGVDFWTQDTWRFINSFAPWLSAFGTISAVVLSLYLATRDRKVRLEVSAGYRVVLTPGNPSSQRGVLGIYIVNVGHREAQVINVGWKVGIFRKRLAIQQIERDGLSSTMPVRLKDGEEARYYLQLNDEDRWSEKFVQQMLQPFPKLQARFVTVVAYTSVGRTFEARIEKGLQKQLIATVERSTE